VSDPEGPFGEIERAATLAPDDPLNILDSPTAGGRVIRGGVLRLGTYGAGVALGILAASLMTRQLGVEDFGRYVIVTSLIAIVAGLTEAGIPSIAARELATSDRDERDRLLANVLGIRISIALLGVLVAAAFAVVAGYDRTMVIGTVVAGIGLVVVTVQQTYSIALGVALRFGWLSALDLIRQAAFVTVVVALVLADAGLLPLLAATVPASLLPLAVTFPLIRGSAPLLPRFERSQWLGIVRLVGIYAAAAAVGTIYVSAVVIVTSLVGTPEESGYLGAAFRIFSVLGVIPLILVSTAFPVLARAAHTDQERLQYAVQRLVDIAVIVGTWMALATALGAAVAIDIVAGADFAPAVPVLQILSVVLLSGFLAVTGALALVSLHRHVALLVGNLCGLAAIIVLTAMLVPSYGAKGAALSMLCADAGLVVLYGIVLFGSRVVHYDLELVPRVIVAGTLAAALVFTPLERIPLVVAATVVYWGVLAILRGIPPEVIDALLRREPRSTSQG
jgi:O-antigen/teichoic acid export membrane protein